jgi:hypothetical protein
VDIFGVTGPTKLLCRETGGVTSETARDEIGVSGKIAGMSTDFIKLRNPACITPKNLVRTFKKISGTQQNQ